MDSIYIIFNSHAIICCIYIYIRSKYNKSFSIKEAKFRKGIMRRIELICNYLKTTDSSLQFDFIDIEPVFTRNRPVNELEIAQMMQTLTGILSEETIIGMFPAISDPQAELKKKQDENESVFEQPYKMQQETAEVGEEDGQE